MRLHRVLLAGTLAVAVSLALVCTRVDADPVVGPWNKAVRDHIVQNKLGGGVGGAGLGGLSGLTGQPRGA